jgi:hypothetical protein
MVKRILLARIPKTVKPDAVAKLQQAVQLFSEIIGEDTPMSDEDYKAMYKIADKRKQECDDVFALMKTNPTLVKKPLSIAETQQEKDYYEFSELIRAALKSLTLRNDREQNISGGKYIHICSLFEMDVRADVLRGETQAQNVQTELKQINRNRSGNPKKKSKSSKTI